MPIVIRPRFDLKPNPDGSPVATEIGWAHIGRMVSAPPGVAPRRPGRMVPPRDRVGPGTVRSRSVIRIDRLDGRRLMSNSEFNSILNAGARCNGMIDLR